MRKILIGLVPLGIVFLFFSGCARSPDNTTSTFNDTEEQETRTTPPQDDETKDGGSNKKEVPKPGPEDEATCISNCQAACDSFYSSDASRKTKCREECLLPWDQHWRGCKASVRDNESDDFVIPVGMTSKSGTLRHCTHYEDALAFQAGLLSFVTVKGQVYIAGELPWWSFLYSWMIGWLIPFKDAHEDGYDLLPFAAVGKAPYAPDDLKEKASVKIGDQSFTWFNPAAIGFSLVSKISDLDPAQGMVFEVTKVQKGDPNTFYVVDNHNDGSDRQEHVVVTYHTGNSFPSGNKIDCTYTTEFKLHYFPKS